MRGFQALALATLLFSGCVGTTADEPTELPPSSAVVTQETGGIEGNVLTDELQPISRAQIVLVPANMNATSAGDGSFSFSGLVPGTYTLNVAALGYYQQTKTIAVIVGEISTADIILDRVPVALPAYQEVNSFTGTLPISDACQAGEFTAETKDVSWKDYPIVINETKDDLPIAAVYLDIDLKSIDSPASVDVDLYFLDASGKEVGSSHTADPNEHLELEKYIKAGTYSMRVWICTGANVKYSAKVTITYEQGEIAAAIQSGKLKPGE